MSAVHALESALGVQVGPGIGALRRLLYLGEWIESHALHIYLLHAPDFLGYESALEMAHAYAAEVERGLRLKKIGNRILTRLGGPAIHPVSVCVGGFHHLPARNALLDLLPDLEWAVQAAEQTVRWIMQFRFPDLVPEHQFVALSHASQYPINEGRVTSSSGLILDTDRYDATFVEKYVAHSTALHAVCVQDGSSFTVGPLARLNINRARLAPRARRLADAWQVSWPVLNPFMSIVARALELLHACEEALTLISQYKQSDSRQQHIHVRESEGCAATEAPRGLLFHRYRVDCRGLIQYARIMPPTARNLRRIEDDLRLWITPIVHKSDSDIIAASEKLVRSYDPCLSCSTHMVHFRVQRQ
jgi:sulfhydrogenase subunit alpha